MDDSHPPACQAYLVVPPDIAPASLSALLEASKPASLLIRHGGLDASTLGARVEILCPPTQEQGVAVLLEDQAALAAALACDGVHLSDPAGVKAARRALGPEAILGAGCGTSRHDAMVAGESGADYVAFGTLDPAGPPEAELLAWWQALITLPCVALGVRTPGEAGALARAGADFVMLGPEIWGLSPSALREAAAEIEVPAG